MNRFLHPTGLPALLFRLWHHLDPAHRRRFWMLLMLMLASAIAEVVSLGAVLPFIGSLTAPERLLESAFVRSLAEAYGLSEPAELILPLTVFFITAVLIASAIRMLLLWTTTRFTLTSGLALSAETYRRTLYQPYLVHVARNSSGIISGLTNKVNSVVFGVVLQGLVLMSSVAMLLAIVAALVAVDPQVAVAAAAILGTCYVAISWLTRHRMRRNSEMISQGQTRLVQTLQDGLGGIRDVLLDGTQPAYCATYRHIDHPLRLAQCNNTFIAQFPRFLMEALGMVMIAALAFAMSREPGGIASSLPVLGALALGAQRLLPALQQAYSAWQSVVGNRGSLVDVIALLDQPIDPNLALRTPDPLPLRQGLSLDGIGFRYGPEQPWVLKDVTLAVAKGDRVGIVGATGSGKSTLMDVLMGLLPPTCGSLQVDGTPVLGDRIRAWQSTIAHVPQDIYLADATVAENIAFGIPRERIDMERVRAAARQAQIAEFIESASAGYEAIVGERGVRLSGGQRQRIGIARALYKRASVLVFDEATSALDHVTEASLMQTIDALDRELTMFVIAHRIGTVKGCDIIVELRQGRVVACGRYDELMRTSPSFRMLAGATTDA